MLSVGVHIIESHRVIKIQNTISALEIERNIISDRIFLFSVLFMLEKNMEIHIRDAISRPIKWKLKFWGLNIVRNFDNELGKYVHVSNAKAV
jgi:hypothetical protein